MQLIDTDELKHIELGLLKEFKRYCDKHGLKYYLCAGTLLGAVRHKGFIPWDDDIDVAMPRPDFERFYQLTRSEPVSPLIGAVTYRETPDCICPFIKLQDLRTQGHEEDLRDEFSTSAWIDVFPLDGVPSDNVQRKAYLKKLSTLIHMISLCARKFVPCANPIKLAKRFYIHKRYSGINVKDIDRQIENEVMKYPYSESDDVGIMAFSEVRRNVISRSVFDGICELEFEGEMFSAPAGYDKYLTALYGDYMTPPPPDKQIGKHDFKVWWKDGFKISGVDQ